MKRSILILTLSIFIITLLPNCSKDKSQNVIEFAHKFGKLAEQGNIVEIRDLYPEAANATAVHLKYNSNKVEIFPEGENIYTIKYGNGSSIKVRTGLQNSIEVISSTGILTNVDTAATNGNIKPEPSDEEVAAFAKKLKANVKAGDWEDIGWNEVEDYYGNCAVKIKNNNDFDIEGSDYDISYKYEYLYGEGVMKPQKNTKKGKTIPAGGTQTYTHTYTDDCGPTRVTVLFKLTDRQLYDKYAQ